MNTRKEAREVAFKLVFEYLFSGETNDFSVAELAEENGLGSELAYTKAVYHGVIENYDELANIIKEKAIGFAYDRVYKVDKAIMLVALYEILKMKDIPYAVSINEAIELAKKYGTEKSGSFINGILSKVEKK